VLLKGVESDLDEPGPDEVRSQPAEATYSVHHNDWTDIR
jgi:hypothetical protein